MSSLQVPAATASRSLPRWSATWASCATLRPMTTDNGAVLRQAIRSGQPAPLGQQETIEGLLRGFRRQFVPIRKSFVQQGRGMDTQAGPLAAFLTGRDSRGLDAYLLLHAMACAAPWNCDLPSGFWVRALGIVDPTKSGVAALNPARPTVSKIMRRLVDRQLVDRARVKRRSSLILLREDGSGAPYKHPHATKEQWFQLPHDYWYDGYYRTLSLPAKVMLLIALERPDGFNLPQRKAPRWYGVSEDTADRGLRELRTVGLLRRKEDWVVSRRSDIGWTQQWKYSLQGAFSDAARSKASTDAKSNSVMTDGTSA